MDRKFLLFALGIFFISTATLCYEVALSYEFSFMFWYMVSFAIITIAMFGLGVGGVVGYFLSRFRDRYNYILFYSSLLFGVAIAFSLWAVIKGSSWTLLKSNRALFIYFSSISTVPFIFSGIVLSMGLNYPSTDRRVISFIYFSDLVGAGIGAFLITALLPFSTVEEVILLCSSLAIFSSLFFRNVGIKEVFAILILAVFLLNIDCEVSPEPVADKFLTRVKEDGAKSLGFRWSPVARVDVIEYPSGDRRFVVNGYCPVEIYGGKNSTLSYLMFQNKPKSMLAIGSGGGVELAMAVLAGVERIVAVEINPAIVDYMLGEMADFSKNIYYDPRVEVVVEDGRTYVHRTSERFDLIENGVISAYGLVVPSTSVLTFQDAYVYTVEGNRDYYRHLTPGGVAVSVIHSLLDDRNAIYPERGVTHFLLRQYFTVRQALVEEGIDPERHMMIFRQPIGGAQLEYTFIFKNPLEPQEVENFIREGRKYGLDCLYAPFYNSSLNLEEIAQGLPLWRDVSPVYDDKPFFYHMERSAPRVLYFMLASLILLTSLFLILPIAIVEGVKIKSKSLLFLIYFLCLGIGYILIEAVLIPKLTLFLGRPAYAFQVVLFSMLIFSGLGSYSTGIFSRSKRPLGELRSILLILVSVILIYAVFLPKVLYALMHLGVSEKVAVAIGILAPLSFIMGMPFPLGLRIISSSNSGDVVWMYGVNSAGSVLGSVIGMIIAFTYGFSYSIIGGGAVYLLALLTVVGVDR